MSTGTTYHVWVHYVKGSGSNAQSSVGFSTDGTRPTSGNKFTSYSNGTETADADNVRFMEEGGSNARAIIDKVRVDDATIGDNPS
jgi:hypothetical protein